MEEGEWFSNEGSVAKGAKRKGRRNGTKDFGWKDNTSSKGTLLDRVSRLLDPRDVPTRICADMLPVIF